METLGTMQMRRTTSLLQANLAPTRGTRVLTSRSKLAKQQLRAPAQERRVKLDRTARAASSTATTPAAVGTATKWDAAIVSTGVFSDFQNPGDGLEIVVVDAKTDTKVPVNLSDLPFQDKPTKGADGLIKGWTRRGAFTVPASITPGALLITKKQSATSTIPTTDFIYSITLQTAGGKPQEFVINTWISSAHGQRVFFNSSAPTLPKDTPKHLLELRQKDLDALRGDVATEVTDRVYGYQVYDDLSVPGNKKLERPPLGGIKNPYPRHQLNLKPLGTSGCGKPWVPYDEEFDFGKELGFKSLAGLSIIQGLKAALDNKRGILPIFKNFEDVYAMFKKDDFVDGQKYDFKLDEKTMAVIESLLLDLPPKETLQFKAENKLGDKLDAADAVRQSLGQRAAAQPTDPGMLNIGGYMMKGAINYLKKQVSMGRNPNILFEQPLVMKGRQEVWATDEEFGRQFLTGKNLCVLRALKQNPVEWGSAIRPSHVDDELKKLGSAKGMEALVKDAADGKKPRLYYADYWLMDYFWKEDQEDRPDRAEHAGRCILYLQEANGKDVGLIPIVIELKHKLTQLQNPGLPGTAGIVYARQELAYDPKKRQLWRLAKGVFKALDAGWHQLISHWMRAHACIEPFHIALMRNLSQAHPVYKLMHPHFKYTLDINMRARGSLINAAGIVENSFSPGEYALRLSSAVYGALWRFKTQALPDDLEERGMVDANGQPWTDYPYAADGLDIWNGLIKYYTDYLSLYYKSASDVLGDNELQAWWDESKNQGHADIQLFEADEAKAWGFAGPIPNVDALAKVLATISFTTSAHHAAVNFSQYAYSGLTLNSPTLQRKAIPRPSDTNTQAYKDLTDPEVPNAVGAFMKYLKSDSPGKALDVFLYIMTGKYKEDAMEREYLKYVSGPRAAILDLVIVQLLSTHDENEHTLDEPNPLIKDPKAVALNKEFMGAMKALEPKFIARNNNPDNWTRATGNAKSIPYEFLIPASPGGLTNRGVPYSVSI